MKDLTLRTLKMHKIKSTENLSKDKQWSLSLSH